MANTYEKYSTLLQNAQGTQEAQPAEGDQQDENNTTEEEVNHEEL